MGVVVTLLALLSAPGAAPAEPALDPLGPQRQVVLDDPLPRALELLATDAGVVLPMQGGPFAVGRAAELVQRLQAPGDVALWDGGPRWWELARAPLALPAAEAAAVGHLLRSFALYADETLAFQLSLVGGPELYARRRALEQGPAWDAGFGERLPVLGLDGQVRCRLFADVEVWGRATADLKQDQYLYSTPGAPLVASNVVAAEAIDVSFPHRALVGVGGRSFSLDVGRDRLALGNGRTGNLLLGDVADYQDFARAQLFGPAFTWTSLIVRLDPVLVDAEAALPGMDRLRSQEKHLVVHRLELVLLEKLHLAASEGTLVGGVPLDLRHLNPLLVFHNLFGWNEVADYRAASILATFEATLVPVRGLRLWAQLGINQLQTVWERAWFPDAAAAVPDALGGLAGLELTAPIRLYTPRLARWAMPTGVVHLYAGGEIGQTDPWFGVRENPLVSWSWRRRVLSNLAGRETLVEQPLGWPYGPDSRVWRLWLGGQDLGLGTLELGYEERLQGEQSLRTPYEETLQAAALRTPTGTPQTQRVLSVLAELWLLRHARSSARLRLDWRHFWVDGNRHVEGAAVDDDQLVLGLRLVL